MITSINLKNFKCFAQQQFHLAPLTVLCGMNGAGKSTLLQSLLLLRQSQRAGLLDLKSLLLNGELVGLGRGRDVLFETAEDPTIAIELKFANEPNVLWEFDYSADSNVLPVKTQTVFPSLNQQALFGTNFQYLEAERTGPSSTFQMAEDIVSYPGFLGTKGEFTAHFLSQHEFDNLSNEGVKCPGTESSLLRDQVEAWLNRISPGTRIHLLADNTIDLVKMRYSFVGVESTTNQYRSTNVGFGITYVLPIIVAVLAASQNSLLVIENPEAHLHPDAQFEIGTLLALAAQSGVQVLIETHSDHILNSVRVAVHSKKIFNDNVSFYFFKRRPDGFQVETPTIDSRGRFDKWPSGFFDRWEKSLDALLD